jgi:prenyltransferase beta subunit
MSSHKQFLYAAVFSLTALILVSQFAAALPRKDLLSQFIASNELSGGGFRDTTNSTVIDNLEFSSYASIWILSQCGSLAKITNSTNTGYFLGRFRSSTMQTDLEKMYDVYEGLTLLGTTLNSSDISPVVTIIANQQDPISYGYKSLSNPIPTVSATYYAVALLSAMNQLSNVTATNVVNYIKSNWNANLGAFINSNESTTPNPIDSYYAISTLILLHQLSAFTEANRVLLRAYIDSFYCNNTLYPDQVGGYTYSQDYPYSSIALTDYCVSVQLAISGKVHTDATIAWLLARQSAYDYGFQDLKETDQNVASSAIASYYALQALVTLNSNVITNQMSQDVWQLSTDPWIIAAIVIGVVAGVVLIFFAIWKLKNRM